MRFCKRTMKDFIALKIEVNAMKKLIVIFAIFAMYGSVAVGFDESRLASECDNGNNQSCKELVIYYTDLCNKNDGKSCAILGDIYNAIQDYKKACDLGHAGGCNNLGVLYKNGQGVRQDYAKASELFQKACNLGHARGCFNLGVSYNDGLGVRQDYKKANELYQKACDLGEGGGCNNLGVLYAKGQGVRQDKSIAKDYYGKACDMGEQIGCDNYRKLNEQGY